MRFMSKRKYRGHTNVSRTPRGRKNRSPALAFGMIEHSPAIERQQKWSASCVLGSCSFVLLRFRFGGLLGFALGRARGLRSSGGSLGLWLGREWFRRRRGARRRRCARVLINEIVSSYSAVRRFPDATKVFWRGEAQAVPILMDTLLAPDSGQCSKFS